MGVNSLVYIFNTEGYLFAIWHPSKTIETLTQFMMNIPTHYIAYQNNTWYRYDSEADHWEEVDTESVNKKAKLTCILLRNKD